MQCLVCSLSVYSSCVVWGWHIKTLLILFVGLCCCCSVLYSCHVCVCVCLFFCVSVFSLLWFIVCPNVCLASLFSLAIHCLTAEVFFAAIRFLHCAILCSWRPGMQTVSPPLFHWMLHVLLRCTSLHPLLFISSVAPRLVWVFWRLGLTKNRFLFFSLGELARVRCRPGV